MCHDATALTGTAVIPCEMLRVYSPLPDAIGAPPRFWPVEPREILMVGATISTSMRPAASATAPPLCADPTSGTRRPARSRTHPATDIVVGGFADSPTTSAPESSAVSHSSPATTRCSQEETYDAARAAWRHAAPSARIKVQP